MKKIIGYLLKGLIIVILLVLAVSFWYLTIIVLLLFGFYYYKKSKKRKSINDNSNKDLEPKNILNESENSIDETNTDVKGKMLDCGLYYGDIILLDWLNGSKKMSKIPSSYTFSYGINPLKNTYELIKNGYIKIGKPAEGLNALKVTDLKRILKEHSQKVSGIKKELINRIIKNIPEDNYSEVVPKVYVITDKGAVLLKEYGVFVWAKKNPGTMHPIDYIPYQHATRPFESVGIKLRKENILAIFEKNSRYPYSFLSNFEYEIADFAKRLNDKSLSTHYTFAAILDYFSFSSTINSEPTFIYPKDWNSAELQSRIIKEFQIDPMDKNCISENVILFKKEYGGKLPFCLTNDLDALNDIISDAVSLSPSQFHENRLSFLKAVVPKEMVFDF